MKNINSKYFKLNLFDLLKGLIVAAGTAVLNIISEQIITGKIDWNRCLMIGLSAMAAYLGKNLFTNSGGDIGGEGK